MSMKRKSIVIHICQEDLTFEGQKTFLHKHEKVVQNFLEARSDIYVVKTFFQLAKKQKNRNRWFEIIKALQYAQIHDCDLIFSSIVQHHSQIELGEKLLEFFDKNKKLKLYCLDQNFINENNIREIITHYLQRRRKHGLLIKEGLQKTHLKSGNPQASKIITKVNRPKILCSVVYAMFFDPIISFFEKQKLAQRKIIFELNKEGLSAPEGGKWVLSQYQKVLSRVKLNRLAFSVGHNIEQMLNTTSYEVISHSLAAQYPLLLDGGKKWTIELVKSVFERYQMIKEIEFLNDQLFPFREILIRSEWSRLSGSQISDLLEQNKRIDLDTRYSKVI